MADNENQADDKSLDIRRLEELVDKEEKWAAKVYAAARYYISLDWPVIPIAYGQKQIPGRESLRKRGLKKQLTYQDASTVAKVIEHWFHPTEGIWRGMNIGLVCGDIVSVVDLDEKQGKDGESISGSRNFDDHIGLGSYGQTPVQETPSGGVHIVFKHERGFTTRTSVLPGVDTRGSTRKHAPGSHIVVYPSVVDVTSNGKIEKVPYVWKQGGSPVDVPQKWLETLTKVVEFKSQKPKGAGRGNEGVGDDDYFPEATLEDVQDALKNCDPTDYDTWIYVGMSLHSMWDGADGFDVWHDWSREADSYKSEKDCWSHWESFEQDPDGISIATLFGIARKNGYRKPGELSAELIEELRYTEKGHLKNENHNLWVILQSQELSEQFGGYLKYDEFQDEVRMGGDVIVNEGYTRVARWISTKFHFERGRDTVREYSRMVAMDNPMDTLKDYMGDLVWDGKSRLERLSEVLHAKNDFQVAAIRRWLIGGVARAYVPGCSSTHMLILHGAQGIGKSRFFKNLCPDPTWFTDSPTFKFGRDTAHRDEEIKLQGRWIVEVPELAGIYKSDFNDLKNFLTLRAPVVRKPYATDAVELPRRCIFGGSTNQDDVLNDPTGARRFAFLSMGKDKIDVEWVMENRDQIWAESKTLYQGGEQWWFNDAEFALQTTENRTFQRDHPWADALLMWADDKSRFTLEDMASAVLHKSLKEISPNDQKEIKGIFTLAGWVTNRRINVQGGGTRPRAFINPNAEIDAKYNGTRWYPDVEAPKNDGEY